ncbi:MAG: hypothetical protein JST12_18955 [Armatimonadetes bacterium]|nr:hypothetical protein [Armatimonadota bacterium]
MEQARTQISWDRFAVFGLFGLLALLMTGLALRNHLFVLICVILIGFSCAILFGRRFLQNVREVRGTLGELEQKATFVAPTLLGWIATSDQWITASSPVTGVQRICREDLAGAVTGLESQIDRRHGNVVAPPRNLLNEFPNRPWIYLAHSSDPDQSIFVFFRKQSELDVWRRFLVDGEPLPRRAGPNPLQIFVNAKGVFLMLRLICAWVVFGAALIDYQRQGLLGNALLLALTFNIFGDGNYGIVPRQALRSTYQIWIWLAGGKVPPLPEVPDPLVGNTFIVTNECRAEPKIERIPLSSIRDLRIEERNLDFMQKDLAHPFVRQKDKRSRVVFEFHGEPRSFLIETQTAEALMSRLQEAKA